MMFGDPRDPLTQVRADLGDMGVPEPLLRDLPDLEGLDGLLVYGSRARGDAVPGSDLDLLGLVQSPRSSVRSNDVHLSYYTRAQLSSGVGTLFGAHLKRDGRVLLDKSGELRSALERMGSVDTGLVLSRSRYMSQLFTTPEIDLPTYLPGLLREARYLLRSCLYADAIAEGRPCFSVRELALRHDDPDLARLLASRHQEEPSVSDYSKCRSRLELLLGPLPSSQHGSLEATIVNEWGRTGDLLSMAFMALGASSAEFDDYAEVEKVLL